jgi:hypothetical protein
VGETHVVTGHVLEGHIGGALETPHHEGDLRNSELELHDGDHHLESPLNRGSESDPYDFRVGDFPCEEAALREFNGACRLEETGDSQCHGGKQEAAVFEGLREQKHVDGTVGLDQSEVGLKTVHGLRGLAEITFANRQRLLLGV